MGKIITTISVPEKVKQDLNQYRKNSGYNWEKFIKMLCFAMEIREINNHEDFHLFVYNQYNGKDKHDVQY